MVAIVSLVSLFLGPLMLAAGLAFFARRTGHGLAWQLAGLGGFALATACVVLPVDAYFGHKARFAEALALGLGYLFPALLLVILSLKRWPIASPPPRAMEPSK
jgi:hypothetical protein